MHVVCTDGAEYVITPTDGGVSLQVEWETPAGEVAIVPNAYIDGLGISAHFRFYGFTPGPDTLLGGGDLVNHVSTAYVKEILP